MHVRDEFEAPIAGADVRLAFLDHARGDIEMVADDDGTCELGESLPPGRIRILATAAGRVGVQRIGFLPDPEAVVEAGVTIHSGYSVPLSSTTVFVAAASGNPVAGANVELRASGDGLDLRRSLRAVTDEQGKAIFAGYRAQAGIVVAEWGAVRVGHSFVRTSDLDHVVVRIVEQLGGVIAGQVTDSGGVPAAGVELVLYQAIARGNFSHSMLAGRITTDDAGRYRFDSLSPGQYEVCASPLASLRVRRESLWNSNKRRNLAAVKMPDLRVVSGTVTRNDIVIDNGATVRGRLLGAQRTSARVVAHRIDVSRPNLLRGAIVYNGNQNVPTIDHAEFTKVASIGADGAFVIAGLAAGNYQLRVEGAGLCGERFVRIESDASNLEVNIAVGRLAGIHGEGPPGAWFALVPDAHPALGVIALNSIGRGVFALNRVPAGRYSLFSDEDGRIGAVTLHAGQSTRVDIVEMLGSRFPLSGTITNLPSAGRITMRVAGEAATLSGDSYMVTRRLRATGRVPCRVVIRDGVSRLSWSGEAIHESYQSRQDFPLGEHALSIDLSAAHDCVRVRVRGAPVVAGFGDYGFQSDHRCGASGSLRIDRLHAGVYTVIAEFAGGAKVRASAELPRQGPVKLVAPIGGSLRLHLADQNGDACVGVAATVVAVEGGEELEVCTDHEGNAEFPFLADGSWKLRVSDVEERVLLTQSIDVQSRPILLRLQVQ